ncbi:hypothetical protein DPEC_G00355910 [Dallia pectoralis]|uniref:Uncharacterized protein n=1 Tax=Dallia pectoralis TaxID=75939 RepID=A0ACC2EZQ3_DALPE|nr:hypothetical protein DPEC_G00355910 [Dallia pectoralis]
MHACDSRLQLCPTSRSQPGPHRRFSIKMLKLSPRTAVCSDVHRILVSASLRANQRRGGAGRETNETLTVSTANQ